MLRALALLLLLSLQFVAVVPEARAAECPFTGGGIAQCSTRQVAWQAANAAVDAMMAAQNPTFYKRCVYLASNGLAYNYKTIRTNVTCGAGAAPEPAANSGTRSWAIECAAGSVWNESTHTCFDADACLAKPPLPYGSFYKGPVLTNRACMDGCSYGPSGNDLQIEFPGETQRITIMSGWKPVGEPCGPNEVPVTDPTPQECVPISGMTVCVKPDGQHCYSTNPSRQNCWTPGEVGVKTDGPVVQQRNGGDTPAPPPAPPPGDTLNPGPSVTTTTHTTNTTITTTTTNYSTGSGADGSTGGKNDGEAGDGSGSGKDDEGDGKEKFGTVTGDVNNCHAPPTITPGDNPLDAHLLNVEWLQNCQGLDGLNSEIDAAKALVLEQEAVWNSGLQDYEGWAAYYDEHKSGTADQVINKDGDADDPTMLDSGGFLGAAECPSIPALTVAGVEIPFDLGPICGLLSSFGTLIVAFAYFLAARMIATN